MSEIVKRLNQCRKPTGELGKVVAEEMNKSYFELTNGGFKKININDNDVILDIGCGGVRTVNRLAGTAKHGKILSIYYISEVVINKGIMFDPVIVEFVEENLKIINKLVSYEISIAI